MKILVCGSTLPLTAGDELPIALKLAEEGNEVYYHSDMYRSSLAWAKKDYGIKDIAYYEPLLFRKGSKIIDLVVTGSVKNGGLVETLRNMGYPVIGANRRVELLEKSRKAGKKVMEQFGIPFPPTWTFSKKADLVGFIEKKQKRFAIKVSEQFYKETYVGRDFSDTLDFATRLSGDVAAEVEQIVDGVEMAVGAWFNGKEFIKPVLVNFEHKRALAGDQGELTGEMGTVGYYVNQNKLFDETLSKIEKLLRTLDYHGYIDINCIVTKSGPKALEFTCRFGYPTLAMQLPLHKTSFTDLMVNLATGKEFNFDTSRNWGIVISYAFMKKEIARLYGLQKATESGATVSLSSVGKDGKGYFTFPGKSFDTWDPGFYLAHKGKYLQEAQNNVYSSASMINTPLVYRNDIGNRIINEADILLSLGYISQKRYNSIVKLEM